MCATKKSEHQPTHVLVEFHQNQTLAIVQKENCSNSQIKFKGGTQQPMMQMAYPSGNSCPCRKRGGRPRDGYFQSELFSIADLSDKIYRDCDSRYIVGDRRVISNGFVKRGLCVVRT